MKNRVMYSDGRMAWVDENGVEVQENKNIRTKQSHPYNYSPIILWNKKQGYLGGHYLDDCEDALVEGSNNSIYTDRMSQWDHTKYNTLYDKYIKDSGWNDAENVEKFLREYNEDPNLELLQVVEYCHAASGYPLWRLDCRTTKK